jgi:hypothetical protein
VNDTPTGRKEQVRRSTRRKADRQSSGGIVKNLFGAGVREVRKMGRRVSVSQSKLSLTG